MAGKNPMINLKALGFVMGQFASLHNRIGVCVFTGDLNGLDMFKKLDFICSSINANYEVRGSSIFINGEGCK